MLATLNLKGSYFISKRKSPLHWQGAFSYSLNVLSYNEITLLLHHQQPFRPPVQGRCLHPIQEQAVPV